MGQLCLCVCAHSLSSCSMLILKHGTFKLHSQELVHLTAWPCLAGWLRLTAQFSLAQLNTNWSNRFCTVQRQPFESYRFFFHFFLLLVYVSVCDQRAIDPDALFPCVFCVFKWSCTALFRSKHMSVVEIKSDEHFRLHTLRSTPLNLSEWVNGKALKLHTHIWWINQQERQQQQKQHIF